MTDLAAGPLDLKAVYAWYVQVWRDFDATIVLQHRRLHAVSSDDRLSRRIYVLYSFAVSVDPVSGMICHRLCVYHPAHSDRAH